MPTAHSAPRPFIKWFADVAIGDTPLVGGKNASLGEPMRSTLFDLACSGVMFTVDTRTGFSDAFLISAAYGLGENVVRGFVTPDEYVVFKPTLKTGHRPIPQRTVGSKEFKLVYDLGGGKVVRNVPVRLRQTFNDQAHDQFETEHAPILAE